ncbi:MAG: outer membrane protein transport protein [Pseudomonadales bacterium]
MHIDGRHFNKPLLCLAAQLMIYLWGSPQPVYAAGPYLPEIASTTSVGTAGAANPTNTYDASAAVSNPAAMAFLQDNETASVGAQVLAGYFKWHSDIATGGGSDSGNTGPINLIPGLFYSGTVSEDWRIGFGLAQAFGVGAEYGDNFVGRYQAITSDLQGKGFTTSLSYQLNKQWSIGLGLAAVYTTLELSTAISTTPTKPSPTTDGKIKLDSIDGWSPQGTLGVFYSPINSPWTVGFVYRTETRVNLKGDFIVSNLPLPSGTAKVKFEMPERFEMGASYQHTDALRLFVEADYERWSQGSLVTRDLGFAPPETIDRRWRDTYRIALGSSYQLSPHSYLFTGASYDMAPATDKNRTFDAPVDAQTRLNGAYKYKTKTSDYSVGMSIVHMGEGVIDQMIPIDLNRTQTVHVKGELSSYYVLFVYASLNYHF